MEKKILRHLAFVGFVFAVYATVTTTQGFAKQTYTCAHPDWDVAGVCGIYDADMREGIYFSIEPCEHYIGKRYDVPASDIKKGHPGIEKDWRKYNTEEEARKHPECWLNGKMPD